MGLWSRTRGVRQVLNGCTPQHDTLESLGGRARDTKSPRHRHRLEKPGPTPIGPEDRTPTSQKPDGSRYPVYVHSTVSSQCHSVRTLTIGPHDPRNVYTLVHTHQHTRQYRLRSPTRVPLDSTTVGTRTHVTRPLTHTDTEACKYRDS